MNLIVRPIAATDRGAWDGLYQDYAVFYDVTQTSDTRERVFGWLMSDAHGVSGLCAIT